MTDPENPKELPEDTEMLLHRWSGVQQQLPAGKPSYVGRVIAIALLLFVAPLLLFLGTCGVMTMVTVLGPIMLGLFAATAFISFKGVQALWTGDSTQAGWTIGFVVLAILAGMIYIWANQPLGWHN